MILKTEKKFRKLLLYYCNTKNYIHTEFLRVANILFPNRIVVYVVSQCRACLVPIEKENYIGAILQ